MSAAGSAGKDAARAGRQCGGYMTPGGFQTHLKGRRRVPTDSQAHRRRLPADPVANLPQGTGGDQDDGDDAGEFPRAWIFGGVFFRVDFKPPFGICGGVWRLRTGGYQGRIRRLNQGRPAGMNDSSVS